MGNVARGRRHALEAYRRDRTTWITLILCGVILVAVLLGHPLPAVLTGVVTAAVVARQAATYISGETSAPSTTDTDLANGAHHGTSPAAPAARPTLPGLPDTPPARSGQ